MQTTNQPQPMFIKNGAGLHPRIVLLMDGLLPLLRGHDPMLYITTSGRLDVEAVDESRAMAGSAATAAAEAVLELWRGSGTLGRLMSNIDERGQAILAEAFRVAADVMSPTG